MYAIIKTGGKQYKVQEGDVITVERLDAEVNAKVTFEPLMLGDEKGSTFGAPIVAGASVSATVLEHGKGKKVQLAIYKKMNGHHRAQGHRQPYSKIKIDAIKK
ncbi:MAG: 50S ribosomal protein L21 [Clostridia bacterium]|nr:50S ribosomal protein L21 [Clostridia bacterium]